MKTVDDLYYDILLLVGKNNQRQNSEVKKESFIQLYNRESLRWLRDFITNNRNTSNIFSISELLVKNYKLVKIENAPEYILYKLPEEYFDIIPDASQSVVRTKDCQKSIIYNYIKKPNINVYLEDKFTKPNILWERGLGEITSSGLLIYKENFEVDSTTISFYRKPTIIQMQGYINSDGSASVNINPQESDYVTGEILNRVASELSRQWENPNRLQLDRDREQR